MLETPHPSHPCRLYSMDYFQRIGPSALLEQDTNRMQKPQENTNVLNLWSIVCSDTPGIFNGLLCRFAICRGQSIRLLHSMLCKHPV